LTTPSEVQTYINRAVCFGVGFPSSRIIGYVKDDLGKGLPGVEVEMSGDGRKLSARTDDTRRFLLSSVGPGVYELTLKPDAVPPGYGVDTLESEKVDVELSTAARVQFSVKAYRNISGRVRFFDRSSGTYKTASGIEVRLQDTGQTVKTAADGLYLF